MTLPQGWVETTVGDVAETKLGKMLDAIKNKGEPVAYLRNVNVRWGAFDLSDLLQMRVTADGREALQVRDGDLFMCEGGEPGRCAVWRGGQRDIIFQKAIHRVRPLAGIDANYLAAHVARLASEDGLSHLLTGTTIKHLPQVALQRIALPLPPAAEQRRIVAKLDALTARLAHARAELDRVPVLAERLREGSLSAAFNGALIEEGLGAQSAWRTVPFGEVAEIASNLVDPAAIGGLPHIAPNHIASGRPNLLPYDTVAEDGVISGKHRFYPGQIIYSKIRPYLRKVVLLNFAGACSADMYPINARCNSRYLMYWMLSVEFTWLASQLEGRTVLPKINQKALNSIPTPVAPDAVQEAIADRLDEVFARADRLEAEATRARALIDRLESAILARAFRGELVPQDSADEPASVLLDRIRAQRAAAPKAKRGRRPRPDA